MSRSARHPEPQGPGTWEWDLVAGTVDWSPQMYRIHCIHRGDFAGTAEDYLRLVHPQDRQIVEGVIQQVLDGGEPRPLEYRICCPDGGERRLLVTYEIVHEENGRAVRIVGTARDVTHLRPADDAGPTAAESALQQSEERFRALIENSFDVIALFDSDGRVLYVTPSCRSVLGYAPEELIGRAGSELVHPEDLEDGIFQSMLISPGASTRVVHRLLHKDGSYRTGEIQATNLLHHEAVGGLVVNLRDITEREAAAEALRHAQKMEAVGRLAGGIAHDFNNLLTVILGEVELTLAGNELPGAAAESLRQIRVSGERAAALTRQLLAFSRRELVRFEDLDLNQLVNEAAEMLRRLIEENVALELDLEPDLFQVRGNRSQIEQLLVNLAINARDAMPRGGTLSLSTKPSTIGAEQAAVAADVEPGDYALLRVSDTGHGMPEEVVAHIFEPFFTTKKQSGTGLGLATCYSVVKQHGGHIEVTSREGAGTTITVYLPRAFGSGRWALDEEPLTGVAGSETILLVEDELAVCEVARRMLQTTGYEALTAADGEEALAILEQRGADIDLLVTDVVLPGIGGRELAERVRARRPEIPVLYISGYTEDSSLLRDVAVEEADLLRKPFTGGELVSRVRELLDAD